MVVRLNVGGKEFCTLKETLLRSEDSYFNGLLSGRFDVPKTEDGALFIDRNGDAFGVILEFLRTGLFLFHERVSISLVRSEAVYYSLMNVVEALDDYKEKRGYDDEAHERKIPRDDGFYTNNRSGAGARVLHFRGDGKLTYLEGESARNNVYIFQTVRDMPDLWKKTPSIVDGYARFCQKHLQRGIYEVEGECLTIRVTQSTQPIPGVIKPDFLLFPRSFVDNWDVDAFERYSFVSF